VTGEPRPKPTIKIVTNDKRLWDFTHRHRLRCPAGHHIPNNFDIYKGVAFTRCVKWIAAEKRECCRWLWVYAIDGGGAIVCEVKQDEKELLGTMSSTTEMLNYLGIWNDSEEAA